MRKLLLVLMLAGFAGTWALAQPSAPGAYRQPITSKADLDAAIHTLPQDTVASYLYTYQRVHSFDTFSGKNGDLKKAAAASDAKLRSIGAGLAVDLVPDELFGEGLEDGSGRSYAAVVESEDAYGLRLIVDLSALAEGDEVYVLDPTATRAFGPYTRDDHVEGGRWLPMTGGPWCVLLALTQGASAPAVTVQGLSHIYEDLDEVAKVLGCNINIACETDAAIQQVSSAIGVVVVPSISYDSGFCSCSLINNADTAAYEPYVMTSNHCVPDVANAPNVDVLWDYRADTCGENDAPSWSSLPRSDGDQMLVTSSSLDITLFSVESVPSGSFGRYYLGWTARDLVLDEPVIVIHHPDISHMRISYGAVDSKDLFHAFLFYYHQNEMLWDDGVTEGGSSGSPLMLVNNNYAFAGTLSNGPTHVCGGSSNTDRFSSFADFFSSVEDYLTGDTPPDPSGSGGLCAAEKTFAAYPEMIEQLRAFRDSSLMKSAWGQKLVKTYYANADAWADAVEQSPQLRALFFLAASPFAKLGASLR